ncbi:hypothetical protein [Sporolactobacillus sp. KGMB 08714]|uniref:hypothetical protein n=1 Tax=Sporolactobacillus sp. KGMB 08714 TaxID=3064704 RepID=UPI002FBDCF76
MTEATEHMSLKMYNELCEEIDILYLRIQQLEIERKYYWKMGARSIIHFDQAMEKVCEVDDVLRPLYAILEDKEYVKKRLEQKISTLDGIDYKVAIMKIQGKSLIEIADELGYSYSWIKRVSSKISNRLFKMAAKKVHG